MFLALPIILVATMADPLTVLGAIASSVQIIDVLTKATSMLDTLRVQWQSSDIALLSLTSQLGALSAALSKIQEWMESGVEEVHHQLVMDLDTSISCCKMLATKLYSEISDLQKAPGGSLLTTAKTRFMFKRRGIGELQSMVDRQIAALTLLLTACNRYVQLVIFSKYDSNKAKQIPIKATRDTSNIGCSRTNGSCAQGYGVPARHA
jgi:hypothetical protein